jgi:hypothetical protein
MRQLFMTIFAVMTLTTFGQTRNDNKIINVRTEKHINIPGTRLYVIPPGNFKIATNFVGLQNQNLRIISLNLKNYRIQ